MKKLLFILIAFPTLAFATAPVEDNDTTIVINKPNQVIINQSDSKLSVEVKGANNKPDYYYKSEMTSNEDAFFYTEESQSDWNFKVPFVKSRKEKKSWNYIHNISLGGFGMGLVNAVDAEDGVKVDMGASFEFMVDNLLSWEYYPSNNTSLFSIGFGFNWKNYRMTSRSRFIKENDNIVVGAYPQNADINFSRIKVFSLTVPMTYTQVIAGKVSFSLGPVININTHASLKTRYKLDGDKVKITDNNVHQSPITVDFMGCLRFNSVGLYVKYSPNNVLDSDYAPKFKSLSTGVKIFF